MEEKIVLKLSLYGIFRVILPVLPKSFIYFTYIVFCIGVITIFYASSSTIRTTDVKELIAYSSVCHAAVYLMSSFSNSVQGIEGSIILGLAHGFVSSGLFICVGGVLYDRVHTRVITFFRGLAQIMPLFAILFFILALGNCGVPLTLNFVGEFLSLYGIFERLPIMGALASVSIIFSAAYSIFLFNRVCFGGGVSASLEGSIPDINKREATVLSLLAVLTVALGLCPSFVLNGLHYQVSGLVFASEHNIPAPFSGMLGIQSRIPVQELEYSKPQPENSVSKVIPETPGTWLESTLEPLACTASSKEYVNDVDVNSAKLGNLN